MENFILVVDDNIENLNLIGNILKDNGFKIALAKDGKDALRLLETERPSLILLDLMMPGMDGYEVCRNIKMNAEISDIPIIFLTAMTHSKNVVTGFEVGGADYVTKPFKSEELLIRIKNQLFISEAKDIIQRQAEQLFEMNATRDHLFSVISHDMRAPLTSMLMMLQAIRKVDIAERKQFVNEALEIIDFSANEAHLLMDNLLNWSQEQLNTTVFTPVFFNLVELIQSVTNDFRSMFLIKDLKIEFNLLEECLVFADEGMIKTVLKNILHNAVKYSYIGRPVAITISRENGSATVTITDQGVGMPREMLNRILYKNTYYSSSTGHGESGAGLGIRLCKSLLKLNRGYLHMESNPNAGTMVKLVLPVKNEITESKRISNSVFN